MSREVELHDGTFAEANLCCELESGDLALWSDCVAIEMSCLLKEDTEECDECGYLFRKEDITCGTCEPCYATECGIEHE